MIVRVFSCAWAFHSIHSFILTVCRRKIIVVAISKWLDSWLKTLRHASCASKLAFWYLNHWFCFASRIVHRYLFSTFLSGIFCWKREREKWKSVSIPITGFRFTQAMCFMLVCARSIFVRFVSPLRECHVPLCVMPKSKNHVFYNVQTFLHKQTRLDHDIVMFGWWSSCAWVLCAGLSSVPRLFHQNTKRYHNFYRH